MSNQPQREVPPVRRALYYAGMLCTVTGFVVFGSAMVLHVVHFGDFNYFASNMRSHTLRLVFGFALIGVGQGMVLLGRAGLAGSGVVLDPQKARKDLEPWSRSAGGMLADALDEAGLAKKADAPAPPPVVKVRCRGCAALNDEHAKFCNQCGQPV